MKKVDLIKYIGIPIAYISRRDWNKEKVYKFQKYFIYIFTPIFLLTSFNYDFRIDGAIFGTTISLNVLFSIINFSLIGIVSSFLYLYKSYFGITLDRYYNKMMDNEQVACAYKDSRFGKNAYKIFKGDDGVSWRRNYRDRHILLSDEDRYYFDDWRTFKFVGMKESRKLKLQKLMNG